MDNSLFAGADEEEEVGASSRSLFAADGEEEVKSELPDDSLFANGGEEEVEPVKAEKPSEAVKPPEEKPQAEKTQEEPIDLPKSIGGASLPDAQNLGSNSTVNAVSATAVRPEPREVSPEKVKRSKADIMRLRWQAETGQRKGGVLNHIFTGVVPYLGGIAKEEEIDKIQRMKDFADGNPRLETKSVPVAPVGGSVTGYVQYSSRPLSDDEQLEYEASYLGVPKGEAARGEGESQDDYRKRLSSIVGERFKDAVRAQKEARQELDKTEMGWTDTIVVDGLQSVGYALELMPWGAVAGAPAKLGFSLLSRAGLKKMMTREGAKLVGKAAAKRVGRDVAIAAGPSVPGAVNEYRELTRDEYDIDDNGNVFVRAKGDERGVGTAAKAFGGRLIENTLENLVGDVVSRPVASKAFQMIGRVGKEGSVLRGIGRGVNGIYRSYNRATEMTGFGDILFEELPEEDVQYVFSDILGLGKKKSEYEGILGELKSATRDGGQFTVGGQVKTALAMVMQMGLQSAYAGSVAGIRYADAAKSSGEYAEATGLTKETVDGMSNDQKIAYARLHNAVARQFKGDPKRLQEALDRCGKFVGMKTDELAKQATYQLEDDLAGYGVSPRRFNIKTENDEKGVPRPKFEKHPYVDPLTGEESVKDAMVDEEIDPKTGEVKSSVTIIDQGNGSYSVLDGRRVGHSFETDSLREAVAMANLYSMQNQKNNLDNERKAEYARRLLETKYKRNTVVCYGVADVLRMINQGLANPNNNGSFLGITDPNSVLGVNSAGEVELRGGKGSGGFATPDGHIVVVLDNVKSPADMNRILSHEPGHVTAKKDNAARLEFLKKADPNSEYGQILAQLQEANVASGRPWSDDYIYGEAFSKWLERRGHNPTIMQRIHANTLGKIGVVGDAELEVLANQIENETESGTAGAEDFDDRVQFIAGGYGLGPSDEEYLGGKPAEKPVVTADLSNAPDETHENAPVSVPGENGTTSRPGKTASAQGEESGESAASEVIVDKDFIENAAESGIHPVSGTEIAPKNGFSMAVADIATQDKKSGGDGSIEHARSELGRILNSKTYEQLESRASEYKLGMISNAAIRAEWLNRHKDVLKQKLEEAVKYAEEVVESQKNLSPGRRQVGLQELEDAKKRLADFLNEGSASGASVGAREEYVSGLNKYSTENDKRFVDVATEDEFAKANELRKKFTDDPSDEALKEFSDYVDGVIAKADEASAKANETAGVKPSVKAENVDDFIEARGDLTDDQKEWLKTNVAKIANPEDVLTVGQGESVFNALNRRGVLMLTDPNGADTSDYGGVPQFKEDVDRKTGVKDAKNPLEGPYKQSLAGYGIVWVKKDGETVDIDGEKRKIVAKQGTGRHRNWGARNSGEKMWNIVLFEQDGWDADKISLLDGISNIKDGKGEVKDYVKFFNDTKFKREDAESEGLLGKKPGDKGRVAWSIYADATDAVRDATDLEGSGAEGSITPEQSSIIAQAAPKDANERNSFIQSNILLPAARRGMRGKQLAAYAKQMVAMAQSDKLNKNLLVGEQMDLFQSEDFQAMNALAEARAKYQSGKAEYYAGVASDIRAALNGKRNLKLGKAMEEFGITDINDRKQLEKGLDEANRLANYWDPTGDAVLDKSDTEKMDAEINAKADANAKRREELKAKLAAVKSGKPLPKKSVSKKETTAPKPAVGENKKTSEKVVHPKAAENKAKNGVVDENANAKPKVVHQNEPNSNGKDNRPIARIAAALEAKDKKAGKEAEQSLIDDIANGVPFPQQGEIDEIAATLPENMRKPFLDGMEKWRKFSDEQQAGATEEEKPESSDKKSGKKSSSEEITDVGEKIAGARKDLIRDYVAALNDATKEQLAELPFSKAFKKPDLAKAVESGALREQDALFYDAVLALVNPRKPRIKKNDEWRKKYNPGFRSDLDKWVDNTYNALQTLKGFLELDEAGRDKLIEKSLSQEYLDVDADKRRMEELQRMNNRELKFGESYTPNPVHVTAEILRRLGYKAGDKVEIPFPTIRTSTVFDSYTPQSHEGNGIYLDSAKTLDEVIDAMVYLTKLNRGDADLRHPDRAFSIKHTRNIVGETGKFIVMWGGKYGMNNQRKFDTKKEADEFAKSKNSIATPERAVTGRTDYVIRFRNLAKGTELPIGEQKFGTKEEAQKYLEDNRDALNDAANDAIAKEAGRKVEKRKMTPDDLVKIGMFHGSKGLSWGVYVDNPASESGRELLRDGFKGRDEAKKYRDEIKDAYFARWNESNEKRKAFVFFDVGDEKRIGEDWRGGKDMKAEDFMNTFGFRGVQFGNWTNQDDRQMAVNQAFDAFKDLAKLIGVPDKAISLNGELGIAFGARGSGNALAHYEPDEIVINLTKTRGAGSLAHEWWHALDNYFARAAGVKHGMVTDSQTIKMRDELREAFNHLVREIEFSNYYRRSKKQGAYWGRMHEVTARLLAEWVDQELKRNGELNTFLSRGAKNAEAFAEMNYALYRGEMEAAKKEPLSFDEFKKTEKAYQGFPYPTAEEVEKFGGLLRGIFDTVETDADTGILWDTDLLKTEQPNTHDIVKDGKTVFTGRFHTDSQADGYARHFYGEGAKAVRRETVDFDTNLSATLEPEAWGDLDRKVKVVGGGVAPWKYVKGTKVSEHKATLEKMAYANIEAQPNHVIDERTGNHSLVIDGTRIRISKSGLFHSADRRLQNIGNAIANIGDILNNSISVPNTVGEYSYRIAETNFGRPEFVLVTLKNVDGNSEVVDLKRVYSVNVKAGNAAQSVTSTSVPRPTEDSIANLFDAWKGLFYDGVVKHLESLNGNDERPKIDIRNWHDVTISVGKSANDRRFFDLFNHFNRNEESKRIADKVFPLAEKVGFSIWVDDLLGDGTFGYSYGNVIYFNQKWFSDKSVSPQAKADTILHEFIHNVTCYAIDAVYGRTKLPNGVTISKELREAVDDLETIYAETEPLLKRSRATNYAQTITLDEDDPFGADKPSERERFTHEARLQEFLAELAVPEVRNKLKQQNLWERVVNGVRRVIKCLSEMLGDGDLYGRKAGDTQRNALDVALDNLDKFLDNLDYKISGYQYTKDLEAAEKRAKRRLKRSQKKSERVDYDAGVEIDGVRYKRGNEVDFDTDLPSMSDVKEMSEEEQDKLFGFTNDDVRFRMEAMGLKPSKNAKTTVEAIEEQAEFLLSNPDYMKKLVKAVAQWNYGGRTVSAAESAAIGKYYVRAAEELNAEREYVDELEKSVKGGELDEDEDKKELSDSKKKLKESLRWFNTVCQANKTVGSNAGLTLMSRRIKVNANDHSFAGIVNSLIEVSGGTRADGSFKFPDEMIETANELAKKFSELEGEEYKFYANRWKAYSEKVFSDIAKVVSVRKAGEKKVGDAAKIVTRKYLDALTQVEVHSREGNSDIAGLDPKWLKSIAEWHCFQKPDITESEMVSAMREDIAAFFPDITENEIRRAYTQYGHHFKQSKRESQAIMNDRKAQSLKKLQLQTMREEGRLPPTTGMERSDPSDELRALNKEVYEEKKLTPEGAANSLKGIIESIKRRLDNQIADAEREIATGELVPRRERKVVDDVEIIRKRARLAELRKQRDEIFGLHKGMTEEQRVKAVERALASELERATADLDRARSGDFSKRPKASPVQSDAANRYREQIAAVRREIRELKSAKYAFGMTPEEIDALNRRKIENRRKAIENKAFMIETGTFPTKKEQPPMTPEQKKEYEELGRQNQRANQRLRDLRLAARDAKMIAPARWAKEWAEFVKNIVPGVVASFDRSAILRQGLKGTVTHPLMALKDEKLSEKAAFDREFFETLNEHILNDPDIREASENYGLFVRSSDIDYQHDVEMFHGRNVAVPYGIRRIAALAGQIPAVGKFGRSVGEVLIAGMENSERHYVTYLNLMSSQLYKAMLQAIPNASEWQKRQLSEIVNIATGAGGMSKEVRHKVQAFNDMLGHPIWSPNLLVSQLESVIGYDIWGQAFGSAEGGRDGGKVGLFNKERLEVAKEAAKFRLKWRIATTILGSVIAYMFAPDDWWEEWKRKPWYKKFYSFQTPMIGNAHIDLTAGEMTAFRSLVRMFSRTYSTSTGREISQDDFGGKGFWELFGRYLGSKAAPHYGNLVSLLKGKDYTNQDFGWKDFLLSYLPLTPVDIVKIAKDEKWVNMEAPAAIVMALLGAGGNTYEEPFFARTVNAYLDNPDVPSHEKAAIRRAYRDASKLRKSEEAASGAEKDAIRKERESIEGAVKRAAKENTPMRNLGYPQASASFANSYNEYRDIERDQKLTDAERKERLSKIEASNPLMKDDVRADIKKMISGIDRLKDNLKKLNESGDPSDAESAAEIEKDIRNEQDEVMKIVRGAK